MYVVCLPNLYGCSLYVTHSMRKISVHCTVYIIFKGCKNSKWSWIAFKNFFFQIGNCCLERKTRFLCGIVFHFQNLVYVVYTRKTVSICWKNMEKLFTLRKIIICHRLLLFVHQYAKCLHFEHHGYTMYIITNSNWWNILTHEQCLRIEYFLAFSSTKHNYLCINYANFSI